MESDDESEFPSWKGSSATIILLNMYDPHNHGTPIVIHGATCRLIRHYLRQSSNAKYIGVCLYGIRDSSTSILDVKSVLNVIPLTLPTLEDYKRLQNLNVSSLIQTGELLLSDALWHCSKMFTNCKKQLSSRTVVILSCLDIPPVQSDQKPTLKRVTDFVDSGILIKCINISPKDYEIDEFYNNLLIEANKGADITIPTPVWDQLEIEQLMQQESHRHLAVAQLKFEIGEGLAIGVGVYNLLSSSSYSMPKSSDLHRETNTILKSITKTMKVSVEQGMDIDGEELEQRQVPILKSELLYYQEYGDRRVEFTEREMKALNNAFGPPMLKLLGFKPASMMCKEKWFLKAGYFLFPNESIIKGSTIAFKALHQACIETGTVAICVLCTRVNSKPSNVALSPCVNPLDLKIDVGFEVIKIPFIEDLRNLDIEEENNLEISESHKNFMTQVLNGVKFSYKADMFENPKAQSQVKAVEAIALDDCDIEPFVETGLADDAHFQDLPDEMFQELFGPFGAVALKRAAAQNGSTTGKRVKVGVDEIMLQTRINSQTIHEYNVTQLKEILKQKGASEALTGLKKSELVELVYRYYV